MKWYRILEIHSIADNNRLATMLALHFNYFNLVCAHFVSIHIGFSFINIMFQQNLSIYIQFVILLTIEDSSDYYNVMLLLFLYGVLCF